MKNKFKYDYNNKLFLINFILSIICLIFSLLVFEEIIGFIIFLMMAILLMFNSIFIVGQQGIKIKKNHIIIFDQLLIRKLRIENISYVSLKQIPKSTKSRLYGLFNEFFHPNTYMSHCNYTYNQGKVYYIYFHMCDGTIIESYFGWLYREKKQKVDKIENKLLNFIKKINDLCKENRSKK